MDDKSNVCPTCKGRCCRDTDYGYRVEHMGAECYTHGCDYCHDGTVPQPDSRDATLAALREVIRHWAVGPHAQWCTTRAECPCDCGAAQEFEARETARKLVGLGEGEP